MERSPRYEKPVLGVLGVQDDAGLWEVAMNAFEQGKFTESLYTVLRYMNPKLMTEILKKNNEHFTIPHGSMVINMTVKDGFYEIKAPFLKLPEKRSIVLLRQISEINFSTLVLSQIRLEGNELFFYYKSPIELSFPYKIWDVLYEICINADYYDDQFVTQLGAERIEKMQVKQYSAAELDKLWNLYHTILDETKAYCDFYQSKRWTNTAIDSIFIGLMKLDYCLQPQGILSGEIEKILVYDQNISNDDNLTALLKGFEYLKTLERSAFDNCIYQTTFLIPPKRRADLPTIKDVLSRDYESAQKEMNTKNYLGVADFLLYALYNLMYRYMIHAKYEIQINNALEKCSGKSWEDTADILMKAVAKLMDAKD